MKKNHKENTYLRAKARVDRIRGFYSHLIVYVLVNTGISTFKIIRNINNGETFEEAFFDTSTFILWMLWGIGMALHAFSLFGIPLLLGKNWEEEKIKKYMNEDQSTNWD